MPHCNPTITLEILGAAKSGSSFLNGNTRTRTDAGRWGWELVQGRLHSVPSKADPKRRRRRRCRLKNRFFSFENRVMLVVTRTTRTKASQRGKSDSEFQSLVLLALNFRPDSCNRLVANQGRKDESILLLKANEITIDLLTFYWLAHTKRI